MKLSTLLLAVGLLGAASWGVAQMRRTSVGEQPDGSFLVTTNQAVTPAGLVRRTEGVRPKDLTLSPDGKTLAVLTTTRLLFFTAGGEPAGEVALRPGPLGVAWSPNGRTVFASGAGGQVHRVERTGETWRAGEPIPAELPAGRPQGRGVRESQPTGLAVSPDGRRLYAALGVRNAVLVIDLTGREPARSVAVGAAPYRIALSPDGKTLAVANRGGAPVADERPATAETAGTRIRIDRDTDAAHSGSISLVDTSTLRVRTLAPGRQPSGLAFTPDGRRLLAANADSDDLALLDLQTGARTALTLRHPDDPGFGQIPTDVAVSGDGQTAYVACGGANAVAVVRLEGEPRVEGYVPAGWYPIAVETGGGRLYVASSKGIGSRPAQKGRGYGVHNSVGTVQILESAQLGPLELHTRKVAANNRWGRELPPRRGRRPVPVPERVGEPSVFKHVVYILKENHTYDLDLGDIPEGNGDPELCLFGENVTPNGHALAREFVLLDNTYTSGTNSADGHQWTGSAVANGYIEQNYASNARSYPYDGGDPLAVSPEGFLWTAVRRKGLSLRVYGEFVDKPVVEDPETGRNPGWKALWEDYRLGANRMRIRAETSTAALRPFLHPRFIGFPTSVSDQWRADQYLEELSQWEKDGKMPALTVMLLPNDHTTGTRTGMPTPRATVADGDLALGRIVDRISRSRFWKETLILVIMDDSQLGLDHVDGHRTVAYCVSPFTRRGKVVSEVYNHTSFLRTIELVLGLPAMSRFDRTATPLTACFQDNPDLRPFTHRPNRIPLDEMNPPATSLRGAARRLAEVCDRLDWSDVDRAHAGIVARAVWESCRPGVPFPEDRFHAVVEAED